MTVHPLAINPDCSLCFDALDDRYKIINGQQICAKCVSEIKSDLAAQDERLDRLPLAALGGVLGALIGAVVWSGIIIATNYEVGYIAVLIGYLAGRGVEFGAHKGRGRPFQILAVCCALFGLLAAKIGYLDYQIVEQSIAEGERQYSYGSLPVILGAIMILPRTLSPFDLLWVFIAFSMAWKALRRRVVLIADPTCESTQGTNPGPIDVAGQSN